MKNILSTIFLFISACLAISSCNEHEEENLTTLTTQLLLTKNIWQRQNNMNNSVVYYAFTDSDITLEDTICFNNCTLSTDSLHTILYNKTQYLFGNVPICAFYKYYYHSNNFNTIGFYTIVDDKLIMFLSTQDDSQFSIIIWKYVASNFQNLIFVKINILLGNRTKNHIILY